MKTITVFGSSQVRPNDPLYDTAVDIGAGLAQAGFKVMTGGYYGMMEAVSKGARQADGHVIGVTTDQIGERYDLQPNAFNCEIVHFADLRDRLLYMVENADGLSGNARRNRHLARDRRDMGIDANRRYPRPALHMLWQPLARHHWALQASPYLGHGYQGMITIAHTSDEVLNHLNGQR